MSFPREGILRIPEAVVADTRQYRGRVASFLAGEVRPAAFRAYRVPMGIYEQRTPDTYMVRIRIGAGVVLPWQLRRIAELSARYGSGTLHVTTRQDIQIHNVRIEDTPDVLEGLLEAGLSSRGGGGNTVRNITACPRAGLCPNERFDVGGHAVALAEHLMADPTSFNLPRKFKIVFSGCASDCSFASVADLGFFAHVRDGQKGFCVYAGGGLGANPQVGVKIEDFIPEKAVFEVAEAVKRLFDAHGDRANKHKARLRYVLKRLGPEKFASLYRSYRKEVIGEGLKGHLPEIRRLTQTPDGNPNEKYVVPDDPDVLPEKTRGRWTVRLRLPLGNITADDLVRVAHLAEQYASGVVRTTQLQNLLVCSVPTAHVGRLLAALDELDSNVGTEPIPHVIACPGVSTCKLGLCLSRGLAAAISERLIQIGLDEPQTVVRISGCPNSCANHPVARVGFQGRARRIGGRLLPCYDVFVDAHTAEGEARLAQVVGTVPAKEVPDLLASAAEGGRIDTVRLTDLVRARRGFADEDLPEEYFYDYGSNEPFSLAGRGPGECGAGVLDVVRLDLDEAAAALDAARRKYKGQRSEELGKTAITACRALLVLFGVEPRNDHEIAAACREHLIAPGWLSGDTQELMDAAVAFRTGRVAGLVDVLPRVEALVARVVELFQSLDASLRFTAPPVAQAADLEHDAAPEVRRIDLRGVGCPLNFVKAKLELERIEMGEVLDILLDDGEPARNVPASFTDQGQEVMDVLNRGDHYCVRVRRTR